MSALGNVSRREALRARLLDPDAVVVFDGAMGTMLYTRGVFINQCYDELSLRAPDLVRSVHEEYVRAGAEVLETNSFGANRFKLSQFGLEGEVGRRCGAGRRRGRPVRRAARALRPDFVCRSPRGLRRADDRPAG
jgi:methionine synthase / methylenetetrahydrofolate reductase(NADPH)